MKSTALVVIGVAGAAALALSVATGAWASGASTPSPTTIYQAYTATTVTVDGTSSDPTTVLTSQVMPVGKYHVEVALGVTVAEESDVTCTLGSGGSADMIVSNTGQQGNSGTVGLGGDGNIVINGTVTVTQANDSLSVSCYGAGSVENGSLTAQPVDKIKLTQG